MTLRELMTKRIEKHGWFDYAWERGDDNARKFKTYCEWLTSLSDEDFLDAFCRVKEQEQAYSESE